MPIFTIIIPCLNAATRLSETLDSIRVQTSAAFEVICVDDGSTDDTVEIIRQAQITDPRIKLVQNDGKGVGAARNLGASLGTTSQYIAFCDAGDVWGYTKLSELEHAFVEPEVDAVFGRVASFYIDPKAATRFSNVPYRALTIPMQLREDPVQTMSNFAIRTTAFAASGGFDEELTDHSEVEWLIRIVGKGACVVGAEQCRTWVRAYPADAPDSLDKIAARRDTAVWAASRYGVHASRASHAAYMRKLACRALVLGRSRTDALVLTLRGLMQSPIGFFGLPKQGLLTLFAAFVAVATPRRANKIILSI